MIEGQPHSYHTFLFPFNWQVGDYEDTDHFLDCVRWITQNVLGDRWRALKFSLKGDGTWYNETLRYNEYVYFHGFARDLLYDFDPEFRKQSDGKIIVRNFEYAREALPESYLVELHDGKRYTLKVDRILLNIYRMGVGVLSLHLVNENHGAEDDILIINNFGRRLYPIYLPLRNEKGKGSQQSLLPARQGFLGGAAGDLVEDHGYPDDPRRHERRPEALPKFIEGLFVKDSIVRYKDVPRKLHVTPIGDDRMFVHCLYAMREQWKLEADGKDFSFSDFIERPEGEFLYKFLFVDSHFLSSAEARVYRRNLMIHYYERWAGKGTFIGATRFSFAVLLSPNSPNFLIAHFRTMYYRLVEMSLVQRASILGFQGRVSDVSNEKGTQLTKRVRTLYRDYLMFVNSAYFEEVTAQEQGIELHDFLQRQMRIPEQVSNLEQEIHELHEYSTLVGQEAQEARVARLTLFSVLFLVPSLLAGFYGMNFFDVKNLNYAEIGPIMLAVILASMLMLGVGGFLLVATAKGKKAAWRRQVGYVMVGLYMLALLLSPWWLRWMGG